MTLDEIKQYKLETEIERLREEGTVELAKALMEIERLTAAMTEIASQCHNIPRGITADRIDQIARRALEPKP